MTALVLRVEDLSVAIATESGVARILDRVALEVPQGEIVGLVGESGCGKSTLVKTVLGALPRGARATRGRVVFEGQDLLMMGEAALARNIRGRRLGFIPQDPALALNPLFTVGTQLLEIWRWHAPRGEVASPAGGRRRIVELFDRVGLADPESMLGRYPHQFSGGQRQRVLIAAALLCKPSLLVADEPTTALDVTTQQQILTLLGELVEEFGLSVLFVTHDFGVVSALCDRICVMYAGQMVEHGSKADLLAAPLHPYTRALLACHPDRMEHLAGIPGAVPSPVDPPPGCRFHPRCADAEARCTARAAGLVQVAAGRGVGCVHAESAAAAPA
jgi:peptide/nickel transport system ATP-binding protein